MERKVHNLLILPKRAHMPVEVASSDEDKLAGITHFHKPVERSLIVRKRVEHSLVVVSKRFEH